MQLVDLYSSIFCVIMFNRKEASEMPLIFKIDVLEALKAKGYTTYSLREFFPTRQFKNLGQKSLYRGRTSKQYAHC